MPTEDEAREAQLIIGPEGDATLDLGVQPVRFPTKRLLNKVWRNAERTQDPRQWDHWREGARLRSMLFNINKRAFVAPPIALGGTP